MGELSPLALEYLEAKAALWKRQNEVAAWALDCERRLAKLELDRYFKGKRD